MNFTRSFSFILIVMTTAAAPLMAGIEIEPYYSYRSTKGISPERNKGTETETIRNREEKGIRAGLRFFRLFRLQASVGQSFTVTTQKSSEIKDEYDEIDFQSELNQSTSATVKDLKIKETDNRARISLAFDPSFWIFIARMSAGVTARQRISKVYDAGIRILETEPPVTYKPNASAGLGIRWSYGIYAIAEYSFYFYKFPETEPFERALSLNIGFSI